MSSCYSTETPKGWSQNEPHDCSNIQRSQLKGWNLTTTSKTKNRKTNDGCMSNKWCSVGIELHRLSHLFFAFWEFPPQALVCCMLQTSVSFGWWCCFPDCPFSVEAPGWSSEPCFQPAGNVDYTVAERLWIYLPDLASWFRLSACILLSRLSLISLVTSSNLKAVGPMDGSPICAVKGLKFPQGLWAPFPGEDVIGCILGATNLGRSLTYGRVEKTCSLIARWGPGGSSTVLINQLVAPIGLTTVAFHPRFWIASVRAFMVTDRFVGDVRTMSLSSGNTGAESKMKPWGTRTLRMWA